MTQLGRLRHRSRDARGAGDEHDRRCTAPKKHAEPISLLEIFLSPPAHCQIEARAAAEGAFTEVDCPPWMSASARPTHRRRGLQHRLRRARSRRRQFDPVLVSCWRRWSRPDRERLASTPQAAPSSSSCAKTALGSKFEVSDEGPRRSRSRARQRCSHRFIASIAPRDDRLRPRPRLVKAIATYTLSLRLEDSQPPGLAVIAASA